MQGRDFFAVKIGFDISQTGTQKAGCGYFADGLIRHLAEIDTENQYLLYPTFGDSYWDPDWPSGICRIGQPNFHPGLGHRTHEAAKLFWNHPPVDFESKLGNPDIIHANNFYCPRSLRNARLVYTLYDLSFLPYPEWTTEQNRTTCFEGVFHASLYADLIIAISHFSRKHFLEIFPHYPAERVVVVYPASRFAPAAAVPMPKELSFLQLPFWLSVGTLEPRKNHEKLIRAYSLLKEKHTQPLPLVLAGARGWLMQDFEREVDFLNLKNDIIILGYVADPTLQWLYQNCFAFVYPSLFEGFGLPVLEALSLGAPVISSEVTSIPEIVGQGGILVNPFSEKAIYEAMNKLATDGELRMDLKRAAILQASQFSWKSAASKVLQCYQEVLLREKQVSSGSG
jgi:glycosyltransferase involved in cell wall biosynthesis